MSRNTLIQLRRDTAANWTSTNPVLAVGEPGFETNTGKFKVGDGSTTWNSLSYAGSLPSQSANSILGNNTGSTAVPSALTAAQVLALLSGGATAAFSFGAQRVTNVADPSSAQDAATKNYVDGLSQGLSVKPSVAVATTANITLSGEQTIDGVTTSASRVLVKNQTTTANNGIYVSASGAWTRATDMDANSEVAGAFVFVEAGTANSGTGWVVASQGPYTLGTTAMTWTQFSGAGTYSAGTGLTLSGTTFSLSSPVSAANGGTGVASPTAHGVLVGAGASPVVPVAPGASGGIFQSTGASADPSFAGIDGGSA